MSLEQAQADNDRVFEQDGVRVLVDPDSLELVDGTVAIAVGVAFDGAGKGPAEGTPPLALDAHFGAGQRDTGVILHRALHRSGLCEGVPGPQQRRERDGEPSDACCGHCKFPRCGASSRVPGARDRLVA